MEKIGRGLLTDMIQPINQRHNVIDVDHKLEHNQCLIYIAFYSLCSVLPTLSHLLLTMVA